MVILLEISPTLKWSSKFNSIAPLFFATASKYSNELVNSEILPMLTSQLDDFAKGIDMFCEPVGRTIRIFAFTMTVISDHSGRASISNFI